MNGICVVIVGTDVARPAEDSFSDARRAPYRGATEKQIDLDHRGGVGLVLIKVCRGSSGFS